MTKPRSYMNDVDLFKVTINQDTLGRYFRKDGRIYRHITYCAHPTATLEALNSGVQVGGAIGSAILSDFEPLSEAECKLLDEVFNDRNNAPGPGNTFP